MLVVCYCRCCCCCCRERFSTVDQETRHVAYHVASHHAGKCKSDRARAEYAGPNEDTWLKYVHVINMYFDFCLVFGLFACRWSMLPLSEAVWVAVATHFFHYSKLPHGLQCSTLEQYLRMLVHVLIYMNSTPVAALGAMHKHQFATILRVVCSFGRVFPAARCKRNTKCAWDAALVDAGMQLLLMWDVWGHCHLQNPMWPAFARVTLGCFSYLGWRPFSLTHKPSDMGSPRWGGMPVISWGDCQLHWAGGRLVAVQIQLNRTKFNRNPQFTVVAGKLVNRRIGVGKLTVSEQVDTCPCLAWLVWAILNGAFGYAPLVALLGSRCMMGHSDRLAGPAALTCEDVDSLVASLFGVQPWHVPPEMRRLPMMSGRLLTGGRYSVYTTTMSSVCTTVGIALGLNPSKCSAISGRKTVGTAVTNHPQATDLDCTAALGHLNPNLTTKVMYTDATRLNGDTTALVRGQPVRQMPGSVELAHSRNLSPDIDAGRRVGEAARQACYAQYARHRRRVSAVKVGRFAQAAYNKAFKGEMQRQFDSQTELSKCGDTTEVLRTWFFQPLECTGMPQAAFVSWQVKRALNLV